VLNILVPIPDVASDALAGQIAVATDLARVLGARLTLAVEGQFELAGGDWSGPPFLAADRDMSFCPLPKKVAETLDKSAVRWGWIERPGGWRDVSRQVGSAWLLAIPARPADDGTGGITDIEDALIEQRLAVMTVPSELRSFDANGHALVLWDGSREAVHALAAAVPLLRVASRVTLLEIDDGSLATLGCQALDLLAARGVAATLAYVKADGACAAHVALKEIAAREPAYCVLGGFSRPGWMERLTGGVTSRLVRHSPVPLFLKH